MSRRSACTPWVLLAALSTASPLVVDEAAGGDYPGAQAIPHEVAANELHLSALFDPVPALDGEVYVVGTPTGQAAIIVLEDFQLQSIHSPDGGASFSEEVIVAGGDADPAVRPGVAVAHGGDTTLYVAMRVADPAGDVGLQFVRSEDMGQTWTSPLDLLTSASAIHGVGAVRITANDAGRVAVVFRRSWGGDPFARISSDDGSTWTDWVRVDAAVAEGSAAVHNVDVAVGNDGVVHVVYDQNRGAGREIYYTRSTDAGASFEVERSLDPALPVGQRIGSENADIAIADDGGVLVSFWDAYGTDRLYVVRSSDTGVSFSLALQRAMSGTGRALRPVLATAPGSSTVLAGIVDITDTRGTSGPLSVHRSIDHGASFDGAQTLAGEAIDASGPPPLSIVKTPSGMWAVAWRDGRADAYINEQADLYARTSADNGTTWLPENRIDRDFASSNSSLGEISALGNDDLLVAYCDGRDDSRDANVYTNRSSATILDFSTAELRVDADERSRNARAHTPSSITSDSSGHVYVALQAYADGFYPDIHVASSANGGYSFSTPQRVSTSPAGSRGSVTPQVVATADGHVYVAFRELNPASLEFELRFNHTTDFGASWQPQDTLLGIVRSSVAGFTHPEFQLAALDNGRVFVIWSDGTDVFLARSLDAGANFTIEDVDQDSDPGRFSGHPTLCAHGERLIAVIRGIAPTSPASIWGIVSNDSGANWARRTDLRSGNSAAAVLPFVACNDSGEAVAAWSDRRSGIYHVYAARFDGISWLASLPLGAPPASDQFHAEVAYATQTDVVVGFHDLGGAIRTSLSTNGGTSFGPTQRHDDVGLNPAARSLVPNLAADGLGNVWLSWIEFSAGLGSIVVRHSPDSGASYGDVRRLNRELPQGAFVNETWAGHSYSTALPGAALFSWAGERSSLFSEAIVNAYDLDDADRDTAELGVDCDDEDPGATAQPSTVSGVALIQDEDGTSLAWASQSESAGASTSYEIVKGNLFDLIADADYAAATCLATNQAQPSHHDDAADPPAGQGVYYLVRARNSCGTGGFGDSSLQPDPRDALDAGSACP